MTIWVTLPDGSEYEGRECTTTVPDPYRILVVFPFDSVTPEKFHIEWHGARISYHGEDWERRNGIIYDLTDAERSKSNGYFALWILPVQ